MQPPLPDALADRVRGLALARPTPFYLYDTEAVRARCREFAAIPWPDKSIHFATMANASPAFLRVVRDAGINVFVNSAGHLEVARSLGWTGEQIVFTASAMGEVALRAARAAGAVVNLDSAGQLEAWWRLFPEAPVGIRCNVGDLVEPRGSYAGYFVGKASRLGLSLPEVRALAGDPRIDGLHLYLGTDLTDLGYFEDCYRALVGLAPSFPNLRYLDFGGGFGLDEGAGGFDMAAYGAFVARLMEESCRNLGRPLKLLLEPGRILAGDAGWFVCRVNDVKARNGLRLVGTDASSAQFPRPLFYPEEACHPVWLLGAAGRDPVPTSVYGCSTYSRDFLAREVSLPPAEVGDLLVFGQAGAYCASAHTAFLGFPAAGEVYL